jgi:2-keto-3-deoxy-L-rhamnonate aldolase RhmA
MTSAGWVEAGLRNSLKAKLKEGNAVYGIGLSIGHPEVAEMLGKIGFDWAFIDTEHSPMEVKDVQLLLQAMSASSTVPIVRVPWNDIVMIKRALDIGAYGIIVPWVNTREEAIRAVQAVRYPPEGLRGFGPRRASLGDPDYVKTANDELLLCVQIETEQAVNNIDEILSVEGIDATMIGPYDLSLSLGVFTEWENPKFKSAIQKILESCIRHKVAPGILAEDDLEKRVAEGFRFMFVTTDAALLSDGGSEVLKRCRAVPVY